MLVHVSTLAAARPALSVSLFELTWVKREETRLETQHEVLLRFTEGTLYWPHVRNPRKILECGYGTGEWAVAVAELYEDCQASLPFLLGGASWIEGHPNFPNDEAFR